MVRARVLPTPAQACSMDDAYERQRLANIARNKEVLDGLGLGSGLGPKEAAKKPRRPRAAHVPDNSRVDRVLRTRPKEAARSHAEGSEARRYNAGDDVVMEREEDLLEEHETGSESGGEHDGENLAADSGDDDLADDSGSEDGEAGGEDQQYMELEEEGNSAEVELLTEAYKAMGVRGASPPSGDPVMIILRGAMLAARAAERRRTETDGYSALGTPSVDTTAELPNKRALTRRGNYQGGESAHCTWPLYLQVVVP